MVRGDGDVGSSIANHAEDGIDYATGGGDFAALLIAGRWKSVEVAEEFVCAVDEMNVQKESSRQR